MIIPLRGGIEQDALTGWRRYLRWRSGRRKAAKRSYNRRRRRRERIDIEEQLEDYEEEKGR